MKLAEMIEERRLDEGLTQEELGQQMGVSQATVGQWERGSQPRRTNRQLMERLSGFLGMSRVELVRLITQEQRGSGADEAQTVTEQLDELLKEIRELNARVLVLEGAGGGEGEEYAPRDSNPEPNDSEAPAVAVLIGRRAKILSMADHAVKIDAERRAS